jgi:inorganic pyrophosphatase
MPIRGQLPASPGKGVVHVVVESPRGATSKIKYDEELGAFTLSRPLPLGLMYPHDWGFVPGTRAEDGDPLDAMVLSEGTTFPGMVLRVRLLALVKLEQDSKRGDRERNDRLLAIPEVSPRLEYRSAEDLPVRVRQEIEHFFLSVIAFEKKNAKLLGLEGPDQAWSLVTSLAGADKRRRGVEKP